MCWRCALQIESTLLFTAIPDLGSELASPLSNILDKRALKANPLTCSSSSSSSSFCCRANAASLFTAPLPPPSLARRHAKFQSVLAPGLAMASPSSSTTPHQLRRGYVEKHRLPSPSSATAQQRRKPASVLSLVIACEKNPLHPPTVCTEYRCPSQGRTRSYPSFAESFACLYILDVLSCLSAAALP
jgi:hypothetical protein